MDQIIEFFTLDPSDARVFIAQLIGFVSLAVGLLTFSLRQRRHILIAKVTCDFTSAIHFFLLGAAVGGAVCLVNTARGIVFYHRGQKAWASHASVPVIFAALTLGCSLVGWEGAYSLLPTVGSILAVIGFWCNDPRLLKLFNLPAVTLWLIYSIITGSISAFLSNTVYVVTILVSLVCALVSYIGKRRWDDAGSDAEKTAEESIRK